MASCFQSGNSGVNRIDPAPSTPVETVTMQAFARMAPAGVSTDTPLPLQSTRVAGAVEFTVWFHELVLEEKGGMGACG